MESHKGINSYGSIYALGHVAVENIFDGEVEITEKVDGCVSPDTPILCSDLIYRPAGLLQPGDEIIGFEKNERNRWHLTPTKVTNNIPVFKPCYEIKTTTRTVIASSDHPWLVRARHNHKTKFTKKWFATEELGPGDILIALPVWSLNETWESGYIAGQFDGEGTIVRNGDSGRFLRYYQKTGPELDFVERLLKEEGFTVGVHTRQREGNPNWKRSGQIQVQGGWTEILKFLGTFQPQRLLADSTKIWIGAAVNGIPSEEVVSVTFIDNHPVAGLSTECQTYIANGLLCHNSQISFGVFNDGLKIRSKNQQLHVGADNGMFNTAVERIVENSPAFQFNYVYRGEYFRTPKHNTLAYSRVPTNHIMIYDIERGSGTSDYLRWQDRNMESVQIGFEPVPLLYSGNEADFDTVKSLLELDSILGGVRVEGAVVKNYSQFTEDKKVAKAKFVSAEFQEKHQKEWKKSNPTRTDIITQLIDTYAVPARWAKAVQHLRDDGILEGSPRDIGNLIKAAQEDLKKEEEEAIKEVLYKHFIGQILRGSTSGLPQWFKEQLAEGNINGLD